MELPGSNYLYTLAALAITYSGFAALFMLFRENLAGKKLEYGAFLIRGVVQKGFIVAACSMLPPLLFFVGLPQSAIWRLSSMVAATLQGLFLLTWVGQRRKVKGIPTSNWLLANLFLQFMTAFFLMLNAIGVFAEAGPGPFLIGVTLILGLSAIAYQEALIYLLHDRRAGPKK